MKFVLAGDIATTSHQVFSAMTGVMKVSMLAVSK